MMTAKEIQSLESILNKIETLQLRTNDEEAQERLQSAKNELIRLHQRVKS